jgi:hypothetical protein
MKMNVGLGLGIGGHDEHGRNTERRQRVGRHKYAVELPDGSVRLCMGTRTALSVFSVFHPWPALKADS